MSTESAVQPEATVLLRHGTTRQRAERILQTGPDPQFLEPGAVRTREKFGFSMARIKETYDLGGPEAYARSKAQNFPQEGGPALMEVEVPNSIVMLGIRSAHEEVRFETGRGLHELMQAWPRLTKRIIS